MAAAGLAAAGVHATVATEQAAPVRRVSWPTSLPRFTPRRKPYSPARTDRSPAGLARMMAAEIKRSRRQARNLSNWAGFHRVDPIVVFEASLP